MFFDNIKFWIYTKLINFFLSGKDFDRVAFFLEKKKSVAKNIREKLKQKQKLFV
jgi:hypothetical protein